MKCNNSEIKDDEILAFATDWGMDREDSEILYAGGAGKWNAIRRIYSRNMKHIKQRPNGIDPYFLDWTRIMTPIELMAWGDIRSNGIPFYPQFPVGSVFIDFADPLKKIGIELDGAAYHKRELDYRRDMNLADDGWKVFRIPGREAYRTNHPEPEVIHEMDEPEAFEFLKNYFLQTGNGVIRAIASVFYGRPIRKYACRNGLVDMGRIDVATLEYHCLTGFEVGDAA